VPDLSRHPQAEYTPGMISLLMVILQARAQAQAIEAYRSSKRPDESGKASFKTLKQLVKKGEAGLPIVEEAMQ